MNTHRHSNFLKSWARGVPLLASDLPSLREVISEDNAHFAKADDAGDWTKRIREALDDESGSKDKALHGQVLAQNHTWLKRAERIVEFMNNA